MPRKDFYHDAVIRALVADGWKITHDPLILSYGSRDVYVDLGAELPIGAEKGGRRIAVEVKSFLGASQVRELELAVGQFTVYREILSEVDAERTLYLAIPDRIFKGLLSEPLGRLVLDRTRIRVIVFDEARERIDTWIE